MRVPHRFDNGAALVYSTRFSGLKPQHDPAALGVVIAVLGGTFVLLFKKVMEKIYPEVEY